MRVLDREKPRFVRGFSGWHFGRVYRLWKRLVIVAATTPDLTSDLTTR